MVFRSGAVGPPYLIRLSTNRFEQTRASVFLQLCCCPLLADNGQSCPWNSCPRPSFTACSRPRPLSLHEWHPLPVRRRAAGGREQSAWGGGLAVSVKAAVSRRNFLTHYHVGEVSRRNRLVCRPDYSYRPICQAESA